VHLEPNDTVKKKIHVIDNSIVDDETKQKIVKGILQLKIFLASELSKNEEKLM